MKFTGAFAFLSVASANPFARQTNNDAKSQYVSQLMRGAVPTANSQLHRQLDQGDYQVDISGYSVKFEQCQFVKAYDDSQAQSQNSATVLGTKRFAIFRLCPDVCDSCNYNYGEYLVDLDTYLQATVEYFQNYQTNMCTACDQCGNTDDANANANNNGGRRLQSYSVDCTSCADECYKIQNMAAAGYVDATEFLDCQLIYDPQDDNKPSLYAGPICASGGNKIKIGVFTDEYCLNLDSTKDVEDYLQNDYGQVKLSHALLKSTYTNTCIACKESSDANYNNDGNDADDGDQVIEMCETLYDAAAKCEKTHGFNNGYANYNGYENQIADEEVVCDFMQSLKAGTYDETGEIKVSGTSGMSGGKSTTGGQKFALTFFILGTVGLAVYAAMLHSKLVKGGKSDLAGAGGAMA